ELLCAQERRVWPCGALLCPSQELVLALGVVLSPERLFWLRDVALFPGKHAFGQIFELFRDKL
ncbi:MAG: hypothetical protein LBH73_01725, partial [Spirochaetaceae bacterium]|nr:hypothetical protein [Spirochaetaceae bacterium]